MTRAELSLRMLQNVEVGRSAFAGVGTTEESIRAWYQVCLDGLWTREGITAKGRDFLAACAPRSPAPPGELDSKS